MGRIGINPNTSSDQFEAKMLPNVENVSTFHEVAEDEEPVPEEGGVVDLTGEGVHKIYMHRGQLDVYNFGSRHTKLRCSRGWGKTIYLAIYNLKCVLGLRRMIGLFLGASAKQLYTRTMPNMLKGFNMMGFQEGVFYFLGQAPARLRWEYPLAKPRVWESCVHMQNGAVLQAASMAVKGSCNGINAAWMCGDETKYLPWTRVKEEAYPTLRGDFMPPSARKIEQKRWGYGTDPKINPYYCSTCFVSDAGLTNSQCQWEKEEQYETHEINDQIAQMLAELKYLEKTNPKLAVQLAQNETFLKRLHLLRSQSESFWNFSSLDNMNILGGEAWVRQMKRELPDLMFRIQILGQKKGAAKDGFYSNFDIDIHGYTAPEVTDVVYDKYSKRRTGKALDVQQWPTSYETDTLDFDQLQRDGENCSLDLDLNYGEPLRIAVDCNANLNCMVVGQTREFRGSQTLLIMKEFFVMNEQKLMALCKKFTEYYKPFLSRNGEVIFYFTPTIKQGGSTAYSVEDSEDFRFDKVVQRELEQYGWKVTMAEFAVWRQERKYQFINDALAYKEAPALAVNREAGRCDYLITAMENAAIVPGTFRKDKSREKLKNTDPDSLGGDPRERTDITDAADDLWLGCKVKAEGNKKIGGGLRGRFANIRMKR